MYGLTSTALSTPALPLMASRPQFIDLGNRRTASPSHSDLPSPRSGEIPPALSPLDAFALQSRLLAQQLEASRDNGRRISRLPPLTIANELAKPRPGYLNPPLSAGSRKDNAVPPSSASSSEAAGSNPEISRQADRPVSRYPFIQTFDDAESIFHRDSMPTIKQVQEDDEAPITPKDLPTVVEDDLETAHPSRLMPSAFPMVIEEDVDTPSLLTELEPSLEPSSESITYAPFSEPIRLVNPGGLAVPGSPPNPPYSGLLRTEHSMRSVRAESGDDSDSLSIPGEQYDPRYSDRKLSNSSAFSRPRSPYSPLFAPPRSPSISSDNSYPNRASVNFSRPLSRAGKSELRPYFDLPLQNQALDSPPLRPSADILSLNESINDSPRLPTTPWLEGTTTPLSLTDDENSTPLSLINGAPSYIYAKYSLPRGRVLSRHSALVEGESTHKFEWQPPRVDESNVTPVKVDEPSILYPPNDLQSLDFRVSRMDIEAVLNLQPPARSQSAEGFSTSDFSLQLHRKNPSYPPRSPSSLSLPPKTAPGIEIETKSPHDSPQTRTPNARNSFTQSRMPDPDQLAESLRQLTPEGHLAMGIECHEDGQLQKSTYHLRLAARSGNATAMLLYALACRHGWGMRANQAEGVRWLRKAVDSTGLEVAGDEEEMQNTNGQTQTQPEDVVAKRAHRAQLALSIYELGVSYMNGWGVVQDKILGLRCFEISGSWGDADALAEAGFCYAKGMGCKKDLKKAADLYRSAEKRGVGMAGNSWIYKAKYMPSPSRGSDDERKARGTEKDKDKEKKARDKSRTRAIFGGRKKQPLPTAVS